MNSGTLPALSLRSYLHIFYHFPLPCHVALDTCCIYPGWVDTPAVRSSMPQFYEKMKGKLRSVDEGADTIVWLAASPAAKKHEVRLEALLCIGFRDLGSLKSMLEGISSSEFRYSGKLICNFMSVEIL